MKIKTYILSFVLLILFSAVQCIAKYSMENLASDYEQSSRTFQSTRQGSSVEKHFKKMADGLTDIGSVVDRLATDDERRIIYKSFFGSAIAFGFGVETPQQIFDGCYESKRATLESSKYAANFKFLKAVNTLSHGLVKQFKEGGFSNLSWRSQINEQAHDAYETILTSNFISWFCESLAEYYTEFSFVPDSDREWFAEVQKQIQKGNYVERAMTTAGNMRHYWIRNEEKKRIIAIYKEASMETESYQVEAEAKPIPHRVIGHNGVVTSETYKYPDKCITRADGSKYILTTNTRDVRKDLSNRFLTNLVTGEVGFSDVVSREIPVHVTALLGRHKDVRIDPINYTGTLEPFLGGHEKDVPSDASDFNDLVRSIHKTQSEKSEDKSGCHVIHPSNVYDTFLGRFNEKQVKCFAEESTLSSKDMFKILIFARLSQNNDSRPGNIVLKQESGRFRPILIDHERTWTYKHRVPSFYELNQAAAVLQSSWMLEILDLTPKKRERFHNVFSAFGEKLRVKETEFFDCLESIARFCSSDQTLRTLTHELYANKSHPNMYIVPILKDGGSVDHPTDMFSELSKWIYSMTQAEYAEWLDILNGKWQRSTNSKGAPIWKEYDKPDANRLAFL
jgi:hypothetical protein